MNTITNPYDALYTNLKNRFTVIHNGCEYTVGDFMLAKAGKSKASESSLPAARTLVDQKSIVAIIDYVNEKLTVKTPPKKDKTIRRFPIRTSMSAMLSAVAACALVMSCGIFALSGMDAVMPLTADSENSSVTEYVEDSEQNEQNELDMEVKPE